MTDFSPASAAFEGFRVLRRESKAVLVWVGCNIALFVLIGASKLGQPALRLQPSTAPPSALQTVGRFGPLAYVAAPLLLIFWIALVGAIFRQELRPGDRKWAFMRIGADEVRLALLFVVGAAVVLFLAGIQFALIAGVTVILDTVHPAATTWVVDVVSLAAWCFNFWIVVRLSLAPAHTFASRRLSMFGSWTLTRRHFWGLGWMIVLMMVTVFLLICAMTLLGAVLGGSNLRALDAHRLVAPSPATIIGLIVLVALLISAPVFFSVLIYTPLAFAYRALAETREPLGSGARPSGDAGVPGGDVGVLGADRQADPAGEIHRG